LRVGRSAILLLACVSLALSLVACGGSGDSPRALSAAVLRGHGSIRADGDGDNPADVDDDTERTPAAPDGRDEDGDTDSDEPTVDSYNFPDKDDKPVLDYGRPATGAEVDLLTGIVKRYFALAAAGKAAQACSLLPRGLAEEYFDLYRPSYLSESDKTCQAIVSRIFAHFHKQLAEPIRVVTVRVKGTRALVVIGSNLMPASSVSLMRQNGVWRIQEDPHGHPLQ
jgi:hypothetical protein